MTAGECPDFHVTVRIRNNHLLELREERGWTQRQAADHVGIPLSYWQGLETMRDAPFRRSGEWRPAALRIAEAFDQPPEELWPDVVLRVKNTTIRRKVWGAEALALACMGDGPAMLLPQRTVERALAREAIGASLDRIGQRLGARYRTAVELYFGLDGAGERTCVQVGDELGVTRERARQMIMKGLQHMRWGDQAEKLRRHAQALTDPALDRTP